MEKFSYERLKKEFNKKGYKLLTSKEDYKNTHEKVTLIDKNGYYGYMTYDVFRYDNGFKPFSKHNPYTLQNIKRYLELNNIGSKLLSIEYFGLDHKLKFKCDCGKEFEVSWHHFKCANQTKCRDCNVESYREKKMNSEKDLKEVLYDNNCTLFKGEYLSNKSRLHVIDEFGYKGITCYSRLKMGQYPMKFHAKNPYTLYNIRNYIKINDINCRLVSKTYKNNKKDKLIFMCSCGNTFECSLDYFIRCNKTRCDKCMSNKSNIEVKTEDWLKANYINYIFQYRIDDCRNKKPLPFDFAIFKNNSLYGLIEVDGCQHDYDTSVTFFSSKQTEQDRIDARKRDRIKTNYCKNNKIKLLRLKEFYFRDERYVGELKSFMFEGA